MELDTIGDEKNVLFLIMSDTDTTFNFILAMFPVGKRNRTTPRMPRARLKKFWNAPRT